MITKKEIIEELKLKREFFREKCTDCEAYKKIASLEKLYKELYGDKRVKWLKEYLTKYPPVFTAEELL